MPRDARAMVTMRAVCENRMWRASTGAGLAATGDGAGGCEAELLCIRHSHEPNATRGHGGCAVLTTDRTCLPAAMTRRPWSACHYAHSAGLHCGAARARLQVERTTTLVALS